jgi:hypothetical protein
MALNRREVSEKENKEKVENVITEFVKDNKTKKLDIYELRDFLARIGESGLVYEINKCLTFYEKVKGDEKWKTSKLVKLKANTYHNAGKWKVAKGDTVELPDFEANRMIKEFSEKFTFVEE